MSETRLQQAERLLRDLHTAAEYRQRYFGNMGTVTFHPEFATEAKQEVERIDAFLGNAAPPAPAQDEAVALLREIVGSPPYPDDLRMLIVGLGGNQSETARKALELVDRWQERREEARAFLGNAAPPAPAQDEAIELLKAIQGWAYECTWTANQRLPESLAPTINLIEEFLSRNGYEGSR